MAPIIRRGKIRAQVFGDFSYLLTSFAAKIAQTLGLIHAATATDGRPGGGDGGAGGFRYGR
ncbi:hypothetical protein HanRHA438_Chr01g0014791 [Helianthus annuus]|nr:hypothetical protein HanIR_Chr01g0016141 [Helianthus annuus]KAJ0947398.1 hypothetical protein HanRHA438_Chr01g0014791 [Helianthus annuus]